LNLGDTRKSLFSLLKGSGNIRRVIPIDEIVYLQKREKL
jgi:hypothetical protein